MAIAAPAIHWLLDSNPALRWQTLRDLTDAAAADVATECAGQGRLVRYLLALQGADGRRGGAARNLSLPVPLTLHRLCPQRLRRETWRRSRCGRE